MNIKEIRTITGLSQSAFAKKYKIPIDTLKGWETEQGNKRHRQCPAYIEYLLERLVNVDLKTEKSIGMQEDPDGCRAYTRDEVRDMFLNDIVSLIKYWENNETAVSITEKLQGLAFSILSILDGESPDLPGFSVMAESSEEDIEYYKAEQENYFPLVPEDIAGDLHEKFLELCKKYAE